jgi:pyruvate-formate lyase-activating enzyme
MQLSYQDIEAFTKIMDRSVSGIRPARMYAVAAHLIDKYVELERVKHLAEIDRLKKEVKELKEEIKDLKWKEPSYY